MARNRTSRGMTLLELLLALALSALLMVAIGMAIDLHLRALDSQRTNVEEAQLGRAVLRRMCDDLRGTVPEVVIDFSSVEQMAAGAALGQAANMLAGATGQNGTGTQGQGTNSQGSTGQGNTGNTNQGNSGQVTSSTINGQGNVVNTTAGNTGAGSQAGGARGSTSLATSGRTASMQSGSRSVMQGTAGVGASGMTVAGAGGQTNAAVSEDIAGGAGNVSIPGLYGNQYELQIDVSRLPRLDEYSGFANLSADGITSAPQIPSDVKTIAYYLKTQDTSFGAARTSLIQEPQTGLVRRELDRAVTSYAAANSATDEIVTAEKVLAPEVTSLEFQYFDGAAWTTSWDSDLMGGLPVAVEIVMGIASAKSRELQRRQAGGQPVAYVPSADDLLYRLVVKLPAGKIIEPPATEETTDPAAASGTSTSPTTNSMPAGAMGSGAMGTGARGAGT